MFIKSVQDLYNKNIIWSKGFLWEVKFPEAPAPFNDWFPATSVHEPKYLLEGRPFEFANGTATILHKKSAEPIAIEFIEDAKLTLENWFVDWVDEIFNGDGNGMLPFEDAARELEIVKFDTMHKLLKRTAYWVVPTESMFFEGGNDAEPITNNVTLIVAGKIK